MTVQSDNQTLDRSHQVYPGAGQGQAPTMTHYTYVPHIDHAAIEKALTVGDVSKLTPEVRVQYYQALCDALLPLKWRSFLGYACVDNHYVDAQRLRPSPLPSGHDRSHSAH